MNTYVFFHIGSDSWQPDILVRSIRLSDYDSEVIQVSDQSSPSVKGIDYRHNVSGNNANLMSMRLLGFGDLKLKKPAIYLDTDMIVVRECNPIKILGEKKICMCARSFNKGDIFNSSFREMNLAEYRGMTLNDVYPYIACSTVTESYAEWDTLAAILDELDPKFKVWYGDQESLKSYASQWPSSVTFMPESEFGCLPEHYKEISATRILHFKGERRKSLMKRYASALFDAQQRPEKGKEK